MTYHTPNPARLAGRSGSGKRLVFGVWALLAVLGFMFIPVRGASAATFTVTKTADTNDGACNADCSLREAIVAANASAGPHTITIPAGTYTLSIAGADENAAATGDLDILRSMSLVGAGAASTIIQAGASAGSGIDKVFSVNPNFVTALDVTFSGVTIRYGKNPSGYFGDGFGGGLDFEASGTGNLTLNDCIVTDNTTADGDGGGLAATNTSGGSGLVTITNSTISNNHPARLGAGNSPVGGAIFFGVNMKFILTNTIIASNSVTGSGGQGQGGGIYYFGDATPAGLAIHGGTISNNQAPSDGGGIYTTDALIIDQGTVFSGNSSGRYGGGLFNNATGTTTLTHATFLNNSAAAAGGGIRNDSNAGAALNISFSRIVGNTAPAGSGVSRLAGTLTAEDNWWGCNFGPGTTGVGCPVAPNTNASATVTRWLQLRHTANPSSVVRGGASALAADIFGRNSGGTIGAGSLANLVAFPAPAGMIFSNAVLGTLSLASTQFISGQASATYTAGATPGAGSANAAADGQQITAGITVTAPDLTITKSHTGSFTQGQTGATYMIQVTNSGNEPSSGTVTVADTLPAGLTATAIGGTGWSCSLATLICTRSDALGIGASYPDITFVVDVAATTGPSVTNTATVSGGGEASTGNNTANDPTAIVQAISETKCGFTPGNSYNFTTVNPVGVQIDVVGTLDCITVTRTDANHPNAPLHIQTGSYWTISGAASGGGGATGFQVMLTLPQANLPNPSVCRHTGGGVWDCDDGTHTTSTTSTVTRSNITSFSDWAAGSNVPTAVSLAGFTARGDSSPHAGMLLAGGILGLGGLWLARRRRQIVRVKVGGERTPDTRA